MQLKINTNHGPVIIQTPRFGDFAFDCLVLSRLLVQVAHDTEYPLVKSAPTIYNAMQNLTP